MIGGESCEIDIVGGELFEDSLFVGGHISDVVEMAVQLTKHRVFISDGVRSRMRIQ